MEKRSICDADRDHLIPYGLNTVDQNECIFLTFEPGEYILREGGPIDYLYVVFSGKAKVCLSVSSGRQLILCYFMSRGIVGEVELLTNRREAYSTVQALTELSCVGLPLSVHAKSLTENIAFMNCAGRELAQKLARSSTNGAITILQPLEARLCAYISQTADGGVFREKLTEVAELVGTSYRHLMRCLVKLSDEGVLIKKSPGYQVADFRALRAKAGDLYLQ